MLLYLDACALNRLFDDRSQARVRAEAEAMEVSFDVLQSTLVIWAAGEALEEEISRNPDPEHRIRVLDLLAHATLFFTPSDATLERAEALEQAGYGGFDAMHLASAEEVGADFLLSTDDRFVRKVERGLGNPRVLAMNPLNWIKEVRR